MRKIYFIVAFATFAFTSCKNTEKSEVENLNDSIAVQDTTLVGQEEAIVDSASTEVDSSDVELLNKMSTSTTTKTTDPAKGKFALAETKWKLVELNGKAVKSTTSKDYFINLDSKSGKFVAFVGCNNLFGTYVMKATDKLAFSKIGGTRMACDNMSFESDFITTIQKTDNYMIEGKMLHFHKGKKAVAKFEAIK